MTWDYQGDIAIQATVELKLTQKSQEGEEDSIIFETGYKFDPREEVTFSDKKLFKESKKTFENFYAEYTLVAAIYNIEPQDNDMFGGAWSSDDPDFIFEDNDYKLTVASPPDLRFDSISVSKDLEAGSEARIDVSLTNYGESAATGTLTLFTKLDGTSQESEITSSKYEFTIDGSGTSDTFPIYYDIPEGHDGTFTFIVRMDEIHPDEGIESQNDNEITESDIAIHGNVIIDPPDDDSSSMMLILVIVGVLGVGLVGGGIVIMRSTKSTEDGEPDLGQPPAMAQPGAMPPAAPAAAAGPLPPPMTAGMAAPAAAAPPAAPAAAPAAVQPVTIKCPTCQTSLKITSAQRPIVVACPSCSTKLKLEQ